jgi:hypothetical protein
MDLKTLGLVPWETTVISIGQSFGRLTVRAIGRKPGTYRYIAVCDCACGKTNHLVRIDALKDGSVASCGCGHIDAVTKHGRYKDPLYRTWSGMHTRCYKPLNRRYADYGGRGITVCKRWHDLESFFEDMRATHFHNAEIERIDVNGNYEPSNCRWVTHAEQAANKRNTRFVTLHGKTQRLVEWAKELGLSQVTLRRRIKDGWSEDRIIIPSMDADTRCQLARNSRYKTNQ